MLKKQKIKKVDLSKKEELINNNNNNNVSYEAKDIYVLEGLEPVRKRPGMYIGSTGPEGLHHLIWEVFDNSLDEALAGFAKNIEIHLLENNRVKVVDDGRGIPVDTHHQTRKSALETVMTTLHAGGKFGGESYKISGGLHGVGVSVVCALSRWMRAEVCRNNKLYFQEYAQGKPTTQLKESGRCEQTGTTMIFEPDVEIFKKIDFDWERIINHLRQQAYLTPGVRIKVVDERKAKLPKDINTYEFYFEGGLISYLKYLNRNKEAIQGEFFYLKKEVEKIEVEVAFQYVQSFDSLELSFANNIFTGEGGMHLTGFRTALTRTLNDYARKNNYFKNNDENLIGDDVREGLSAIISVKLREPQFEGQTKAKLGTPEARTAVETALGDKLPEWLELNQNEARKILEKCFLSQKARRAAKAAKETVLKKGMLEGMVLPGKLADCSSRHPEESELFIVEGESAGGSCKMGRDRSFQAILPLKGKILNVEKSRLDKMLASAEVKSLIIALGTSIADGFNIDKLRYHRIIIATDADSDGQHIRTLLLTLFYRYLPKLFENGHIYIAQPPLYKIQSGKTIQYAYSDKEKEEIISALNGAKSDIQRYKGLGEMNPDQLWETTMDPKHRVLKQVTIDDVQEADKIFDVLMGEEVAPRKFFIQTYAKEVKNLDI